MTPAQFARLRQVYPDARLVDVGRWRDFHRLHAAGARHASPRRLAAVAARARAAGEPVYVISPTGTNAARAVSDLCEAGVDNVVAIAGGTTAWRAEGLPVVHGAGPAAWARGVIAMLAIATLLHRAVFHADLYVILLLAPVGFILVGLALWSDADHDAEDAEDAAARRRRRRPKVRPPRNGHLLSVG
jgi:rhodanese-related sulfurtransferase